MKHENFPVNHSGVHRILIAEDDARLAGLLREYLINHGFAVEIESRGSRVVERILHREDQETRDHAQGLQGPYVADGIRPLVRRAQ